VAVRLEVIVEVPRLGFVKRRPDGSVDFVSPLPCPFNYGSVPATRAADGDPLDALILGARAPVGARLEAELVAAVRFVDAGDEDPKLVLSDRRLSAWDRARVLGFFHFYAVAKGALNRLRGRTAPTRCLGWMDPEPFGRGAASCP
jgi:inorganic pyrophosphatase